MLILLVAMVGGLISAMIAASKNRNPIGWFVAGALFPLIGILILVASPSLPGPAIGGASTRPVE
jgi:hypothetical protein